MYAFGNLEYAKGNFNVAKELYGKVIKYPMISARSTS